MADDMEDLIGKVLAGEASQAETAEVHRWMALNDANKKYFNQLKTIFDKAAVNVELDFNEDEAWRKVKSKIAGADSLNKKGKAVSLHSEQLQKTTRWTPLRIAAGIALIMFAAYVGWIWSTPVVITHQIVAGATLKTDTLPDGSRAFLNHKSKLLYAYDAGDKKRGVKLSGEAFFEVKHAAEKTFVIETGEVLIRDIGTAFNVTAYPESNTVEVVVEEGEVQIYTISNPGLALVAGEKGIYDKTLKAFSKIEKIDTNILSYKTKVFHFNNTDLGSVVALVNSVYNTNIVLSDEALNNCRLTVNFNNDKLETIIEVLSETMGLTVYKNDTEILLRGNGCSNEPQP